jgi:hypothetical protein
MKLTTKAQAEAFVFFMLNEKNRHAEDIRQIEGTVSKVVKAFGLEDYPVPDPKLKYWVTVDDAPSIVTYPRNPILADES